MERDETMFLVKQSKCATGLPCRKGCLDYLFHFDPKSLPSESLRDVRTTSIRLVFPVVSNAVVPAHFAQRLCTGKETLRRDQPLPTGNIHSRKHGCFAIEHSAQAIANFPPRVITTRDDKSPHCWISARQTPGAGRSTVKQQFNSCCETFRLS